MRNVKLSLTALLLPTELSTEVMGLNPVQFFSTGKLFDVQLRNDQLCPCYSLTVFIYRLTYLICIDNFISGCLLIINQNNLCLFFQHLTFPIASWAVTVSWSIILFNY